MRNGDHLDLDSSMRLDGGNLTITKLHPQHEGYYQCKVKNKYGTALSHVTFLQAAGKLVSLDLNSMRSSDVYKRQLTKPVLCIESGPVTPTYLTSYRLLHSPSRLAIALPVDCETWLTSPFCTTNCRLLFEVKLTFEMLTVRRQQYSFSTHVRVKVSTFLGQKMSRLEGDSNPQPSDSCRML